MVPVNTGKIASKASLSEAGLLTASEPSPIRTERLKGTSPFVFICDHASNRIPQSLGNLGLPESELSRHIAWDIGAASVTTKLSRRFNAAAIYQNYSRLVIDCNRRPEVFNSVPHISEETPIPGNVNLSVADRQKRIDDIFTPYHDALGQILDDRAEQNRESILVSVHSFTPVFKGFQRPWDFALVYNRDPRLSRIMLELMKADGDLILGDNEPYFLSDETDYTLPVHGEQRSLPHTQFEIRQDHIGTPGQQSEWAERLGNGLERTRKIFSQ
ncbi:MAG: N-formylglutamate amidohydrolase [Rhodospirillales bacterium]|nr:N-formylglutamate amidohydrolase [Rhodospirillales bacterium]